MSGSTRSGHGVAALMSPQAVTGPSPRIRAGYGFPVTGPMATEVTIGMQDIGDVANGTTLRNLLNGARQGCRASFFWPKGVILPHLKNQLWDYCEVFWCVV